jgi:hypothetical protein
MTDSPPDRPEDRDYRNMFESVKSQYDSATYPFLLHGCPQCRPAAAEFSGTWNINLADSDFSDKRASAPDRAVLTVQQQGDAFRYDLLREKDGKKSHGHGDFTVGGPSYESDPAAALTAKWKGDKLEMATSDHLDTWSLSPDGRKLTSDLVQRLPKNGGEVHARRVFDKKD